MGEPAVCQKLQAVISVVPVGLDLMQLLACRTEEVSLIMMLQIVRLLIVSIYQMASSAFIR